MRRRYDAAAAAAIVAAAGRAETWSPDLAEIVAARLEAAREAYESAAWRKARSGPAELAAKLAIIKREALALTETLDVNDPANDRLRSEALSALQAMAAMGARAEGTTGAARLAEVRAAAQRLASWAERAEHRAKARVYGNPKSEDALNQWVRNLYEIFFHLFSCPDGRHLPTTTPTGAFARFLRAAAEAGGIKALPREGDALSKRIARAAASLGPPARVAPEGATTRALERQSAAQFPARRRTDK